MTGLERFTDENTEQLDDLAPGLVELDEPLQTLEKGLSLSLELRESLGVDSVALGEDCEQQIVLRAEVMQQPWSSHWHPAPIDCSDAPRDPFCAMTLIAASMIDCLVSDSR